LLFPVINLPKSAKAITKNTWTQTSWVGGFGQTILSDQSKFATTTGEGVYASTTLRMKINADVVVGQQNFVSGAANQGGSAGANTASSPIGINIHDGKLFIADSGNNRVLIYNSIPTSNNAPADVVIGQSDLVSTSINQGGGVSTSTLNGPTHSFVDVNGKLFVADGNNHRVLIYNSIPTTNNAPADVVIGQPNFFSNQINQGQANAGANTMNRPFALYSDGIRLVIADRNNHRVLIYNTIPTTNNVSADVVVGQVDFLGKSINQGGTVGANTLSQPLGLYMKENMLLVTDRGNERVLVYNVMPIMNNTSANLVVGQPNFISNAANQGGYPAANTFSSAHPIYYDGGKLFVLDYSNNRLLIFNEFPLENNKSANEVIGQINFRENSPNQGGSVNSNTLRNPIGIHGNGLALAVSEQNNHRVLIFNKIPVTTTLSSSILNAGSNQEWGPVSWNASTTEYSSVTVDVSLDDGSTWQNVSNGQGYIGSGDTFQYRVNFANTDGLSTPTLHDISVSYSTTTAPSDFSLVSPVNSSSADINPTFSWNASSDEESGLASYSLYVDGLPQKSGISSTTTSYAVENSLSCGHHTWYIRAFDNAGNINDSNSSNLTVECSSGIPSWIHNNNAPDVNNRDTTIITLGAIFENEKRSEINIINSLSNQNTQNIETVIRDEATIIQGHSEFVKMNKEALSAYVQLVKDKNIELPDKDRRSMALFVNSGTETTKRIGSGERAGAINSYFYAFNVFPQSEADWQDVIKIANGRWTAKKSKEAENKASATFEKVYLRKANRNNRHDDAALTILAYGLRPANRNMDSEKTALRIYQTIFKNIPVSAQNWDIMRAISYSGAVR